MIDQFKKMGVFFSYFILSQPSNYLIWQNSLLLKQAFNA